MFLVLGALRDPFFQESDFFGLQRLALGCRRHDVIVLGFYSPDHFRSVGLAFDDDRLAIFARLEGKLLAIEAHGMLLWLTSCRIRSVTRITIFGKNWLDLIVEGNVGAGLNRLRRSGPGSGPKRQ